MFYVNAAYLVNTWNDESLFNEWVRFMIMCLKKETGLESENEVKLGFVFKMGSSKADSSDDLSSF